MVLDQELRFSLQVFSVIDEILTCDDAHQILDNISLRWFSEGLGVWAWEVDMVGLGACYVIC